MEEATKFCKKCGAFKLLSDFPDSKKTKDGKFADCSICKRAYHAAYYLTRQPELMARSRQYHWDNHEAVLLRKREYSEEHREAVRESGRRYRRENPDKVKDGNNRYYASNKEEISKRDKDRRRADPSRLLFRTSKARALESGVPFGIDKRDIIVPERCPILDIPLKTGDGVLNDGSPTLDKIVPELGYVRGNIAVISHRANTIKNCGTPEEHRLIADWMDGKSEIEFVTHPADRKHAKVLIDQARKRASKRGLPFKIGQRHIQVPDVCPALGVPLKRGVGRMCDSSPSVDRAIPELGYVPENIAIISLRANQIKSYGTAEEHRKVADWMDAQLEVLAA